MEHIRGQVRRCFCVCPLEMPVRHVRGEVEETDGSRCAFVGENLPVNVKALEIIDLLLGRT